ncbi:MAG: glucosaminidase domain-containing protein [Bacteroidota bacterium]
MKYGLTNIRDFGKFNYESATTFVKQNWMKLIIIFFVLFIILKKDISLNFNLHAAGSSTPPQSDVYVPQPQKVNYQMPAMEEKKTEVETSRPIKTKEVNPTEQVKLGMVSPLPYFEPEHQLETKSVPTIKDNRANHFANLTFILNPSYTERKKVDREIVMQKQQTVFRYVKRYADVAVSEMKKYGIPASITLAQGLLESDAGESRLAKKNKNHFGIKCFSRKCKKGHCANFTDDTHKDFFRKYKSVWESYRSHSVFLQGDRYHHLTQLGTTDYHAWAHGLRKAGYATDSRYAEKLIKIIETLELQQYDE